MKVLGKILGIVLLLCGLFVFGYSWRDLQRLRLPSAETFGEMVGAPPSQAKVAPVNVFRSTFLHIQQDFVRPVDAKDLKYAGLAGLMSSLGDPHTLFLEPQSNEDFRIETRGQFAGVGARLGPDQLGARVGTVFEDGPAQKAGLKAGDLITAVDGKSVSGQNIDDIVSKIRGPAGTSVSITVVREGATAPITIRIRRAQVTTPTVTHKMLPDNLGYVNVSIFSEPTAAQFEHAWNRLERDGLNGMVIDLRDNPGGLLESVRDILSLFVENKLAVTLKMRGGIEERTVTTVGKKREFDYPIAVLVNENSASAAEIMAGVMRDYGLATLVGEHTYGKMSVQNVIQFRDGSSAKITIAKYYLPSGEDFSRREDDDGLYVSGGIPVTVHVELQDTPPPALGEPQKDNQLRRAMEVLRSKLEGKPVRRSASVVPFLPNTDALPIA